MLPAISFCVRILVWRKTASALSTDHLACLQTAWSEKAVHVNQGSGPHVAAGERQKTGGINIPFIGNEHDAVAVANLETFID